MFCPLKMNMSAKVNSRCPFSVFCIYYTKNNFEVRNHFCFQQFQLPVPTDQKESEFSGHSNFPYHLKFFQSAGTVPFEFPEAGNKVH